MWLSGRLVLTLDYLLVTVLPKRSRTPATKMRTGRFSHILNILTPGSISKSLVHYRGYIGLCSAV